MGCENFEVVVLACRRNVMKIYGDQDWDGNEDKRPRALTLNESSVELPLRLMLLVEDKCRSMP